MNNVEELWLYTSQKKHSDIKFNSSQSHATLIAFKNDGQFKTEDEGIPILVGECPIGAITKIDNKLVEGYIFNRYMGLEYSNIDGKRCLSGITFGHPLCDLSYCPDCGAAMDVK